MNDLISRDDAIRIVKGAYVKSKDLDDFYTLLLTAFENILPYAQPERKKGYWEHVEIYSANSERLCYLLPDCSCSECGIMIQAETNYCPNCGSYNKGE